MIGLVLGLVAAGLAVASLFSWWRMMQEVALEGRRAKVFWMMGGAAVLGIASLSQSPGVPVGILAGASALVGVSFLGLAALAPQSKQAPAIAVGEPLPDFRAPDEKGEPFELASLRGHPILLKFFRGHW